MPFSKEKIKKGNDLMLFIKQGSAYKSLAFATNHTLTISTESDSISTKDHGYNQAVLPKSVSWEISSENLYIESDCELIMQTLLSGSKYVDVALGRAEDISLEVTTETGFAGGEETVAGTGDNKKTWTAYTDADSKVYYGKALISNLTLNMQAGENATYSITLTGSGNFSHTAPTE